MFLNLQYLNCAEMTFLSSLNERNHKVAINFVSVCLYTNLPLTSTLQFSNYFHTLQMITFSSITTPYKRQCLWYCDHFTDGDTETQRAKWLAQFTQLVSGRAGTEHLRTVWHKSCMQLWSIGIMEEILIDFWGGKEGFGLVYLGNTVGELNSKVGKPGYGMVEGRWLRTSVRTQGGICERDKAYDVSDGNCGRKN